MTALPALKTDGFTYQDYLTWPDLDLVERHILDKGRYLAPERFNWDATLALHAFPVQLRLWKFFERALHSSNAVPRA
jgi:hypothetical protein